MLKAFFAVVLCVIGADLAAQPFESLPRVLSGRWTFFAPGGRTFIDSVSMTFEMTGEQGSASGRLTHRGVNCGALDEPFTGTWDGSVLRIESRLRANVNTTRNGGTCPDKVVYTLKRGGKGFEGEVIMDGMSGPAQVSLAL